MNRQEIVTDNIYMNYYFGLNEQSLSMEDRRQLERHSVILKLAKKVPLYSEGEVPKGVYFLIKGKIKITHLNPDGSEQIYFIRTAGDIFGFRSVLSGGLQSDSAIAMEDSEFRFIAQKNFLYITRSSVNLFNIFLDSISKEYDTLARMINFVTKKSIKERTAYYLLVLNEKFRKPGQLYDETEISISRHDLASYVGSSLENLVRAVKELKDRKYIRVQGKSIYINDFEALYSMFELNLHNNRLAN